MNITEFPDPSGREQNGRNVPRVWALKTPMCHVLLRHIQPFVSTRAVKSAGTNDVPTPFKATSYTAISWVLRRTLCMLAPFQVGVEIYGLKSPPELVRVL